MISVVLNASLMPVFLVGYCQYVSLFLLEMGEKCIFRAAADVWMLLVLFSKFSKILILGFALMTRQPSPGSLLNPAAFPIDPLRPLLCNPHTTTQQIQAEAEA